MNVICYKRVSTDDQADRGFSLQHQEHEMKKWCKNNNHVIVGIYTEDYSGKTFDRPEWNKLMGYVKKNKKYVDLILFNKWDRFSRNIGNALSVIKELNGMGVSVNTLEHPLDMSNPDNKVLLSLYLTIPEVENDKNSIRTTEGSRRARIEGCWTGTAPFGYNNHRTIGDEKSTLIPSKDSTLLIQVFERMSTGSFAAEEVRRWLNCQGYSMSKQTFLNLIRNPVYTGKIFIKSWKKEPEQIVMGLHPQLISDELFQQANDVLKGRKRNMKFHDDKSDLYPLKGHLMCPVHGTSLTAYGARGGSGKIHHYYLCTKCDKKQRHRVEDVHDSIEDVLSQISVTASTIKLLYKRILEKLFDREDLSRKSDIEKLRNEIEKVEGRKSNLQRRLLDDEIDTADYKEMKKDIEKDLLTYKSKLEGLTQETTAYKNYINKEIPMMENLLLFYRKSDGKTKKKILSCIFSEKVVLEKGRVATTPFSIPVQVLINTSKVLEGSKNKKEVENDLLSIMAPPARLERATL